jgi:hypothetical protein
MTCLGQPCLMSLGEGGHDLAPGWWRDLDFAGGIVTPFTVYMFHDAAWKSCTYLGWNLAVSWNQKKKTKYTLKEMAYRKEYYRWIKERKRTYIVGMIFQGRKSTYRI